MLHASAFYCTKKNTFSYFFQKTFYSLYQANKELLCSCGFFSELKVKFKMYTRNRSFLLLYYEYVLYMLPAKISFAFIFKMTGYVCNSMYCRYDTLFFAVVGNKYKIVFFLTRVKYT